jgi:hypothetical protein
MKSLGDCLGSLSLDFLLFTSHMSPCVDLSPGLCKVHKSRESVDQWLNFLLLVRKCSESCLYIKCIKIKEILLKLHFFATYSLHITNGWPFEHRYSLQDICYDTICESFLTWWGASLSRRHPWPNFKSNSNRSLIYIWSLKIVLRYCAGFGGTYLANVNCKTEHSILYSGFSISRLCPIQGFATTSLAHQFSLISAICMVM